MYAFGLSTNDYISQALRRIESCGYAGALVIIARAADSRGLLEELTRDWTSLHDVTGDLLAVIAPDPSARHLQAESTDYDGVPVLEHGLRMVHSRSTRMRAEPDLRRPDKDSMSRFGRVQPFRRGDPAKYHDAWTEAVSRTSRYFGLSSQHTPAMLFISFWDQTSVLVLVDDSTSVYRFCKLISERVELPNERLKELRLRQLELRADWNRQQSLKVELERKAEAERKRLLRQSQLSGSREPIWLSRVQRIDDELALSQDLDTQIISLCRRELRFLLEEKPIIRDPLGDLKVRRFDGLRKLHRLLATPRDAARNREGFRHSEIWSIITHFETPDLSTPVYEDGRAKGHFERQLGVFDELIVAVQRDLEGVCSETVQTRKRVGLGSAILNVCQGLGFATKGSDLNINSFNTFVATRSIDRTGHASIRS